MFSILGFGALTKPLLAAMLGGDTTLMEHIRTIPLLRWGESSIGLCRLWYACSQLASATQLTDCRTHVDAPMLQWMRQVSGNQVGAACPCCWQVVCFLAAAIYVPGHQNICGALVCCLQQHRQGQQCCCSDRTAGQPLTPWWPTAAAPLLTTSQNRQWLWQAQSSAHCSWQW